MSRHIFKVMAILCLAAFSGCGTGDPDLLVPKSGFNYAKVSYDPKPIANPTVIAVPVIHLEKFPDHVLNLELPRTIPHGKGVSFEGSLTVAKPAHRGGIVYVEFLQPDPDGEDRSKAAAFMPLRPGQDSLDYKVQLHAPKKAGTYKVALRMMHPPSTDGLFKIAVGEIEVQ